MSNVEEIRALQKKQGQLIRAAREALKLSRDKLAPLVGVTAGAIQNWEEGTFSPKGRNLINLAAALNKTQAELGFTKDSNVYTYNWDEIQHMGRVVAYPSLQEFLDEQGDSITQAEYQWLTSQRFADGDPGDVGWWARQLLSYRSLKRRTPGQPSSPTHVDVVPAMTPVAFENYRKLPQGTTKSSTVIRPSKDLDVDIVVAWIEPGTAQWKITFGEIKAHLPKLAKSLEKKPRAVLKVPAGYQVGSKVYRLDSVD